MNNKKKKLWIVILGIVVILSITIGISIAFFNYTRTGLANTISVGRISFNHTQNGSINLTNVFPISSTDLEDDENNHDTVTINIEGDTMYSDGIEYLVTLDQVNNIVNEKQIPIAFTATATNIGTSSDDYFNDRGSTTSVYSLTESGTVEEDKQILVGYITKGATGVSGHIDITAYLDASNIAISDTYSTDVGEYTGPYTDESCFTFSNNTITGYNTNCGSDVVIPETINGVTVIGIGSGAFKDANLTSIVIPPTVTSIDRGGIYIGDGIIYFNNSQLTKIINKTGRAFNWANIIISGDEGNQATTFVTGTYSYGTGTVEITDKTQSEIDNNGTTSEWVNGRTVLTTEEWNSLQTNGVSFKVRVEANEGIWVDDGSTPASCFTTSTPTLKYVRNPNMDINTCVSKFTEIWGEEVEGDTIDTGETYEAFCNGTGTIWGGTLQETLDMGDGGFTGSELTELETAGIITNTSEYVTAILDYDASCGSDVIIPSKINTELVTYTRNPNMDISACVSKFTEWRIKGDATAFCNGTGTIDGTTNAPTFQELLDMPDAGFLPSMLNELETAGIIISNTIPVKANVTIFDDGSFNNKGLTNVRIPSSVKKIGEGAFSDNQLTGVTIPNSVTLWFCNSFDSGVTIDNQSNHACIQ